MLGQASSREAQDAGQVAAHAASLPRLLVIDDDNPHRMIISRVAVKAGYEPVGAGDYEEAAELVRTTAFDCITLDLSLGEHAGIEMLRHLRKIGCKAPIVIITGSDGATCRETLRVAKSLDLKVSEPVAKPVDIAVLRYALERVRSRTNFARA